MGDLRTLNTRSSREGTIRVICRLCRKRVSCSPRFILQPRRRDCRQDPGYHSRLPRPEPLPSITACSIPILYFRIHGRRAAVCLPDDRPITRFVHRPTDRAPTESSTCRHATKIRALHGTVQTASKRSCSEINGPCCRGHENEREREIVGRRRLLFLRRRRSVLETLVDIALDRF